MFSECSIYSPIFQDAIPRASPLFFVGNATIFLRFIIILPLARSGRRPFFNEDSMAVFLPSFEFRTCPPDDLTFVWWIYKHAPCSKDDWCLLLASPCPLPVSSWWFSLGLSLWPPASTTLLIFHRSYTFASIVSAYLSCSCVVISIRSVES